MLVYEKCGTATRIYSNEGKKVKDLTTDKVYSECIVKNANENNYIEVDE